MKDKFNKFCADVIGIELYKFQVACDDFPSHYIEGGSVRYNPYDNLVQLAEVVEKDIKNNRQRYCPTRDGDENQMLNRIKGGMLIKQAFREFIILTMPSEDEDESI